MSVLGFRGCEAGTKKGERKEGGSGSVGEQRVGVLGLTKEFWPQKKMGHSVLNWATRFFLLKKITNFFDPVL
ncbi:hypothetical protein BVRB_7g178670 [Beta vulgaris subsp. vulgaris]|uniref:Uncharacterized protein n=1 Tax=Beta vulgaris subsp. vulgaris TaxID=3555 RepID=A0A0J8E1W0_BETVV|nr:hypothetical protein BVRB_7g178670 [Beta vulgaris subsp. vulgaris]